MVNLIMYKSYSIYSQSFSEKMIFLHERYSWRSLRKIKIHLLSLDRRCNERNLEKFIKYIINI